MELRVARLHLNPGGKAEGITKDDVFDFCLANNIIGVGWALDEQPKAALSWSQYVRAKGTPNLSVKQMHDLREGDLVWTKRDAENHFLAEVAGPWEYRGNLDHQMMDIHNVRPANFRPVPLARVTDEIAAMLRQRPTCRFIRNAAIVRDTIEIWRKL